jgi:large subunit ribosomal protein L24
MFRIKKKDKVLVITGREKGKKGEVLDVLKGDQRVLIAKLNLVIRHRKPTQGQQGGRHQMEAPVHISNVMLCCPKCDQAMRPKFDKLQTGEKVRLCRKCGEVIL